MNTYMPRSFLYNICLYINVYIHILCIFMHICIIYTYIYIHLHTYIFMLIYIYTHTCLVFCKLPESVVCSLSLILENLQPLLLQIFVLLFPFSFFSSCFNYAYVIPFEIVSLIGYSNYLFIYYFLSLLFNLGSFYWHTFKHTDSLLGHFQSTDELKAIFCFCYSVFYFKYFFPC